MLALSVLTWAMLVLASQARAHCVAYTDGDPQATVCDEQGLPLYWPRNEIEYVISEGVADNASDALPESVFRRVVDEVFQSWAQVQCPGPEGDLVDTGLQIQASPGSTDLRVAGFEECAVQENVISFLSRQEWRTLGEQEVDAGIPLEHRDDAFALTATWFDRKTGRILGADIEFNASLGKFAECPDDGCSSASNSVDLANVLAHEVGHFLGLAHSQEREATMYWSAPTAEVKKRSLEADDEAGLCALFPPEDREMREEEALVADRQIQCLGQPAAASCDARPPGPWSSLRGTIAPLIALLSLFALVWRARGKRAALRRPARARKPTHEAGPPNTRPSADQNPMP